MMLSEQKAREKLREKYDRSVLVENFCTEKDDEIRDVDRPERYQDILYNRVIPDDSERKLEAKWMAEKLVHFIVSNEMTIQQAELAAKTGSNNVNKSSNNRNTNIYHKDVHFEQELVEYIINVLRYIHVDNLEPPFIWLYRRDYLHPRMTRTDVWKILSW